MKLSMGMNIGKKSEAVPRTDLFVRFNGTDQYGTLVTPWESTGNNWTVELYAVTSGMLNWDVILHGRDDDVNSFRFSIDGSGAVNFASAFYSLEIDGVSATNLVTLMPTDNNIHRFLFTGIGQRNLGSVGYNPSLGTGYGNCIIKSLRLTDNDTTGNDRLYTFNSGSDVYESDDLDSSSTKRIIYTNITESDWKRYTYTASSVDCAGGPGWEAGGETTLCIV